MINHEYNAEIARPTVTYEGVAQASTITNISGILGTEEEETTDSKNGKEGWKRTNPHQKRKETQ